MKKRKRERKGEGKVSRNIRKERGKRGRDGGKGRRKYLYVYFVT